MANKGLLFIPDISGFTRFVHSTEIEHSRLIIQELLETLINTNQIGLEISEIEGDAILFYKFGDAPDLEALYKQVERMFCEFHRQLMAYDQTRFCQCKACISAADLTLKVITHYGEFTGYNVKNFNKLIGKDIIIAHQLLKNDIEQHEYWLITNNVSQQPPASLKQWMQWDSSAKQTENGEIPFHYTQLSQLKSEIRPDPSPQLTIQDKVKVFALSREYPTDIITMFHAAGDFNYRSLWQEGVKKVEEIDHFLPRVGMRSRFLLDNGQQLIFTSSYAYQQDRIEFSETDEKKISTTYFLMEKTGDNRTRLTLSYYLRKNPVSNFLFRLTKKKKIEAAYQQSLINLDKVVTEIPSFAYEVEDLRKN
ncbi:MAG: DUF2652 domain-containing protein [Chitinophagaceae bacterium]|nr:DUF2652 domain-containing protein [Chitinophagaceae bacterium]